MHRLLIALGLLLTSITAQQLSPYDADPAHPANRIFRAIYRVELIPTAVAAALPHERGADADFYRPGWYFESREGTANDRRMYGSDGRQMPRERFSKAEAHELATSLARIDGEVLAALRRQPRLAVYLQSDLLRLARRLLDTKSNRELLQPLHAAARRLALPAAALADPALRTFSLPELKPHLPAVALSDLVEIDRRSTRLFDAEFTQLWSTLHLAVPQGRAFTAKSLLAAIAGSTRETLPTVPLGTVGVMALGIVALDDDGQARATDLVIDVRVQRFANADPLSADNPTTTRDGVDFLQWLLPRAAVRAAGADPIGLRDFRTIAMDSEELFRDYGSLKHTTYAAQCSLCHRRTNTPDTKLAGFSALRPTSKPRVAEPQARQRLAETQMAKFVATLAAIANAER